MFERVLNTSLNRHAKSNQTSFKASYFVIMLRQITVLSVRLLNFMSVKKFCNVGTCKYREIFLQLLVSLSRY